MTHSELIDAYDQAKRSHEAAAVGARGRPSSRFWSRSGRWQRSLASASAST